VVGIDEEDFDERKPANSSFGKHQTCRRFILFSTIGKENSNDVLVKTKPNSADKKTNQTRPTKKQTKLGRQKKTKPNSADKKTNQTRPTKKTNQTRPTKKQTKLGRQKNKTNSADKKKQNQLGRQKNKPNQLGRQKNKTNSADKKKTKPTRPTKKQTKPTRPTKKQTKPTRQPTRPKKNKPNQPDNQLDQKKQTKPTRPKKKPNQTNSTKKKQTIPNCQKNTTRPMRKKKKKANQPSKSIALPKEYNKMHSARFRCEGTNIWFLFEHVNGVIVSRVCFVRVRVCVRVYRLMHAWDAFAVGVSDQPNRWRPFASSPMKFRLAQSRFFCA